LTQIEFLIMTLYQHMLIFYAIMATISAFITWFLTKESKRIRLIATVLIGATWPFSFPVALLLSMF
jgi:Toxin GhoT_OrtT